METTGTFSKKRTLVVGVDASGKSTFLKLLSDYGGFHTIEPTATPEVRAFKQETLNTPVTLELINRREALFIELNKMFAEHVVTSGLDHYATTGSALVTLISHSLMRKVFGHDHLTGATLLDAWGATDDITPSEIIMIHAPGDVILSRIKARQEAGAIIEQFWGFNSPHFLIHYQAEMKSFLPGISEALQIPYLALDSSALSPAEMLERYEAFSSNKA